MHEDEAQTPKPANNPLDASEEQIPVELAAEISEEPLEQNLFAESIIDSDSELHEQNLTDELQEDTFDFLTQLDTQVSSSEAAPTQDYQTQDYQVQLAAERVADLQRQEQALKQEIASLQASYRQLSEQMAQTQTAMGRVVQEALVQLEQRKQSLQIAVEQLERRQERIRTEMRTTFAGASQDLAIRVQGFKDYLTGSLQDLAAAAEQLELVPKAKEAPQPQPTDVRTRSVESSAPSSTPQFTEQRFQSNTKQIRRLLDQYRSKPDYYGPPWQLRRTFEPVQADRVSDWFFKQGGRGALRTLGSRLQNILVSSAIISVLYSLYDTRLRVLVLANTPERLGDWRRGLQDCLGISRSDFGPDRGLVLFESDEAVALKAERLIKANQMPLIIIDDSEDKVSLSLLQFPLLLAFAPDPQTVRRDDFDF